MAILDADKEGFQRSQRRADSDDRRAALGSGGQGDSLRRCDDGTVWKRAIDETTRRRVTQLRYNEDNGIIPQSIS